MILTTTTGDPSATTPVSIVSSPDISTSTFSAAVDDEATAFKLNERSAGGGLSSSSLRPSAGMIVLFKGLPSLRLVPFPFTVFGKVRGMVDKGELPVTEDGVRRLVEAGEEGLKGGLRA